MRDFWEFVIDLLPIIFRSISAVGLEAKTHEAETKTHEAKATTHEAEDRIFDLEAEARPRGLTSLELGNYRLVKLTSRIEKDYQKQ